MIALQNIQAKNGSVWNRICPFPIGYVYMSSNNTSPANIYGGTWSPISGGRYMRAAGAWGNGGSNTITVKQMPAHSHGYLQYFWRGREPASGWNTSQYTVVHTDKTSSPISSETSEFGTASTGGGQHFIQPIKTFGRGTELPKEGDASCVTFNKFKSVLRVALKRFVHSQLVSSICQPMEQAQQALTEVRGHLSQTLGFCGQAVRGTQQAVLQHIHLQCEKWQEVFGIAIPAVTILMSTMMSGLLSIRETPTVSTPENKVSDKRFQSYPLIELAIVGVAPLKVGEC